MHPIAAVQTEYSLWSRDVEREVLPTVRELGIGFVAYSPLGRGFLTGQVKGPENLAAKDGREMMPRFQGEHLAHNLEFDPQSRSPRRRTTRDAGPARPRLGHVARQ